MEEGGSKEGARREQGDEVEEGVGLKRYKGRCKKKGRGTVKRLYIIGKLPLVN